METLATFGGDCEDIAIAKWIMLTHLGIPAKKLRLAYAKVAATGENYMVLAYVDRIDAPSPVAPEKGHKIGTSVSTTAESYTEGRHNQV